VTSSARNRRVHSGRSWYRGLEGTFQDLPSKTAGTLYGVYRTANLAGGSILLESCFQKWHPYAFIVQGPQQIRSGNTLEEEAYKQGQLQMKVVALGLTALKAQSLDVQVDDTCYPG